ncbi:TerS [Tetragenococcus halophilus subsp. halophilus]|uniref:terminase n=1 Tax=Tetragenococcus halophilus TaxID=51669 RepID=UPI000CC16C1D|nr:terminase [Tetragenococcus halophilus]GBD73734.1 TerS [Tetragenococcus halophilus subsp. halophilus]GBD76444.1 TerS [Tetragenococcus halophilus subsp. halophilus]
MPTLDNPRHEKFVQCLITGMSQRKSYREAFKQSRRWKDTTVDSKASTLFKTDKVLERYKELLEEAQDEAIMTRKARMVLLSEIAESTEEVKNQIKAIDTLNKMDGDYIQQIELNGDLRTNPYANLSEEELRRLANGEDD